MYRKIIRNFLLLACASLPLSNVYGMEEETSNPSTIATFQIPETLKWSGEVNNEPCSTLIGNGEGNNLFSYQGFKYTVGGNAVSYGMGWFRKKPYIKELFLGKVPYSSPLKFAAEVKCYIIPKDIEKILYQSLIAEDILKEGSEEIGTHRKKVKPYGQYIDESCFKNTISSKEEDEFYLDYSEHIRCEFQCLSLVSSNAEQGSSLQIDLYNLWNF